MWAQVFGMLMVGAVLAKEPADVGVPLTPATRVAFAGVAEGQRLAQASDEYSRRTSPLERQLKVRTTRELTETDYLAELAADVTAWPDDERERVSRVLESLREPLAQLPLPLPDRVVLVRMSGRVMGATTAYTRGTAIYLPAGLLAERAAPEGLSGLLAHELFHVASRHDRAWRDAMYATIGFVPLPELTLPPALQARRMTNPDAPRMDSALRVTVADRGAVWVMPLLLASIDRVENDPPAHFMQVLGLSWLEVGRGDAVPKTAAIGDPPVRHDTRALQDFFERIGRNTNYIIHAEEILASNYTQLALGQTPKSPEVHARMREVIKTAATRR